MTKEELEKEAEEKYNKRLKQNGYKIEYRNETYIDGYLDSAEPREKHIKHLEESLLDVTEKSVKRIAESEKEIKSLGERCLQLQKDKGNLTDRVRELEAQNNWLEECKLELGEHLGKANDKIAELETQIEKMKCCPNCDFVFRDGICYYDKECKNKDHWKLRR